MSAKEDSVPHRFVPKLRASLIPMVLTILVIVAIVTLGAFGLRYIKDSTFQEGRSFRVLGEMSQQLENMQGSLSSLLRLIPESVVQTDCQLKNEDAYLAKLDLHGLRLKNVPNPGDAASRSTADYQFTLSLDDPSRPFHIRGAAGKNGKCTQEISGTFRKHLPAFISQRYFDEVLLTLDSGLILARIPDHAADPLTIELQADTSDTALVNDASGLLKLAATQGERNSLFDATTGKGDDKKDDHASAHGDVPQHAVGFSHAIGERTYEISVLPIRSDNIIHLEGVKDATKEARVSAFYLIGLKRQNLSQQVSDSLGAGGAFAATIVVLLGVLLWPFLSLRLSPTDSAFAGFQVFAIVVSLVLLPVVVTATAVWAWSDIRLRGWADRGAENYAQQLERSVRNELGETAWLLQQYVGLSPPYPERLPLRRHAAFATVSRCDCFKSDSCNKTPATTMEKKPEDKEKEAPACKLFLHGGLESDTLRQWSPLRTALRLTDKGTNLPPRVSAFGNLPTKTAVNVGDRQYFRALQEQQSWTPDWSSTSFVAQRLFNRSDAARMLQLIVPPDSSDPRQHIVTGDTRAYALSASVKPPLLRFAIVNRSNGEVLFHSNDERSLAENLLMETEHNPMLQQVMRTRRDNTAPIELIDHFDGTYLGEPHRFYYRPVDGIPWGIVVFYSTESLREASLDAAIATMTHCVSVVTLIVLTLVVITFLWNKRIDRHLLASVWPQWEWRGQYPRIALSLTGLWIVATVALLCALHFGTRRASLLAVAVAAVAAVWVMAQSRWRIVKKPGLGCYRLFYAWTVVAALCLVTTLPTLLLAIGYQDLSVGEYLRSELLQSSHDIERRGLLMNRDLRRWVAAEAERKKLYPDGATLSVELPVPGYSARWDEKKDLHWHLTAFNELPWIDVAGAPQPGRFRRLIWRNIAQANPEYADRTASSLRSAHASGRPGDIHLDQETVSIVAAARLEESERVTRKGNCDNDDSCLSIGTDIAHRDRWAAVNAALLLGLCVLLIQSFLVAITARRLCGIRIPFAARYVDPHDQHLPFGPLLATEQRIDQARAEFSTDFTSKDATDIRRIESGPHYREVWRALSPDERHLLHQLALGQFANPENAVVIERLLHRGFIRLRPWPVITDPGLADFARTAPEHEEFRGDRAQWASTAAASTWHRIRVPLLAGGILIAVGFMAFAGGTMQIVLTALAGVTALLGHVTNVTNFVRKDGGK